MNPDERLLKGALEAVRRMVSSPAVPTLPRYAVQERIGEGAMAAVYRARDRELNRPVALKVLKESVGATEEGRLRFRREAQAAAGLSHPNVVTVYDAGEHEGRLFLVMELVEGRTLGALLRERAGDFPFLLGLLEKAARGVAAAHEKAIVHRDLKPSNILVGTGGEPKVADFGLALSAEMEGALTGTGTAVGTPLYMAPEQVRGESGRIGPHTDVYALGAILYEILAGRPPHTGQNLVELHAKISQEDPAPPRKLDPRAPAGAEAISLKALEKDPDRRYATAREFADDLERLREGRPIQARPASGTLRWFRRHRRAVLGTGIAAAAGLLFWVTRGGGEESQLARRLVLGKVQTLQAGAETWQREGRDPSPLIASLRDVGRLIEEGKLAEADALLDRGLLFMAVDERARKLDQVARAWESQGRDSAPLRAAIGEAERLMRGGKPAEAMARLDAILAGLPEAQPIQERLQAKIRQVQEGVQAWVREGRDPSPVAEILGQVDPLMKAGKVQEAEAAVDRALRVLGR